MAAQARNQCLASQEPLENILEENTDEDIAAPEPTLLGSPSIESTFQNEISNLELRNALLALARMTTPQTKKKNRAIKEPDPFSGGSPDELRAFIFQYQIYFRACEGEFVEDSEKIFFAISYLRGIALDYFELFINEPDPNQNPDFLEHWPAFVQQLSNVFGSYSPKDDDEDAIVAIPFPNEGKATDYFIRFAKYQNRIRWDDQSLRKVVKDAVPARISDELRYSKEDLSSFEGYKQAVLRIDNNYWRQVQDKKNKIRMARTLQQHIPRALKADTTSNPSDGRYGTMEQTMREKPKPGKPANWPQTIEPPKPTTSILGLDGKLTVAERTRRMTLGLCLRCGQSRHLA